MIKKLSDIDPGEYMFGIFKGDPGSGKTIAAGSFPNPIFLDFDERLAPLATYYPKKVDYIAYERFSTHTAVLNFLDQLEMNCPYDTVVVDSLTFLAKFILQRVIQTKGSTKDSGGKFVGGVQVSSIEDYGAEDSFLMQIIDKLRRFKNRKHVILTAHVIQVETKDIRSGLSTVSRSLLTGGKKIAKIIPGAFDESYHFDIEPAPSPDDQEQYICYTRHTGNDWAKTALKIPNKLNFTNGNFYEIWRKEVLAAREKQKAELAQQS